MISKIKEWLRTTGIANIAYLGIGIGAKVLFGSNLLLGAGLGIFVYLNWNVIRKLIKQGVDSIKE